MTDVRPGPRAPRGTDVRSRRPAPIPIPPPRPRYPRYQPGSLEIFGLILLTALLLRRQFAGWLTAVLPSGWATVFVAICVQAVPFLVLGVLVSGAIAAFVPASFFARVLPGNPALAIPLAGMCGIALPGCECGSVPIARRLIDRGVRPSAALAFLLSAPAINPIVLVATAVAFQNEPRMVWARLVAGLSTAVLVGWLWEKLGRPQWLQPRLRNPVGRTGRPEPGGVALFLSTARADFTSSAGFLVIGAAAAATLNTMVPRGFLLGVGSSVVLSILVMGALAFFLALCSEADAFVAASFAAIPVVGKLVFLTVGPAVDLKLLAMQTGTFGRRFAVRFAPVTFVVALAVGVGVGLLFFRGWR